MTITITINCDNAAFDNDLSGELSLVMHAARRHALSMIRERGPGMSGDEMSLQDRNGNTCGKVEVSE